MLLKLSADFFQNQLFQKILSGKLSLSKGLDPDQEQLLSVLIGVQFFYKGFSRQVTVSTESVKFIHVSFTLSMKPDQLGQFDMHPT